ncbi:MAG: MBL fold metallo-hydrolase [Calditrichia bacterium]
MKSIKIKFWGVRGSIPTPGSSTLKYGGNTSCVELKLKDNVHFILDAGSGIRELGKALVKEKKSIRAYIFISHFHWDHIQGLPFFRPAYVKGNKITIIGSDDTSLNLDQIIAFQMDPTYFPIAIQDMLAEIEFRSIKEETLEIEDVEIQTIYLNHPGYALGYRLNYNGNSLVYISDNEPFYHLNTQNQFKNKQTKSLNLADLFDNFVENKDERLVQFCRGADILIHDTQYLPEEYLEKITWGHSPFNFTVDLAIRSQVKQLILFHHDPDHDDETVDRIEALSRKIINKRGIPLKCLAAREGMELQL